MDVQAHSPMSRNIIYINMFRSGYVIGSGLWSSTGVHDRPARSTLGGTYTEPSEALYCAHVHRIDEGRYRSRSRCSARPERRSEEHTSELQSLMRISYAIFCLKQNN